MKYRYSQSEIIERFRSVHGNKYDYSEVVFKTVNDKVVIICPKHGRFEQRVDGHLQGRGCPKCGIINKSHVSPYTTESIVPKFKNIHGDRFDYSKVEYVSMDTKVCIICPEHGEFWQKPSMHLRGQMCPACAIQERAKARSKNKEHYITLARKAHGKKYDYSLVNFRIGRDEVKIICPIHGVFTQSLSQHILGRGCPKCSNESHKSLVHGIGINDMAEGEYSPKCYEIWAGMLWRCSGKAGAAYDGVSVIEDWHRLSNFKAWFENPDNGYRDGYHLDKDILVKGNKVYSPNKCCFVPNSINGLLVGCNKQRDKTIGVGTDKMGRYYAHITRYGKSYRLGSFPTSNEAFLAYKEAKEAYIKENAQQYFDKGEISLKVYNALINYSVETTD